MNTKGIFLAGFVAMAAHPALADDNIIYNPCERGPLPYVSVINSDRESFADILIGHWPELSPEVALAIAAGVCSDMSLVRDSEGLTQRLYYLLGEFGID
jgi:hypothetical protein